jgi:hypothetical protein
LVAGRFGSDDLAASLGRLDMAHGRIVNQMAADACGPALALPRHRSVRQIAWDQGDGHGGLRKSQGGRSRPDGDSN